MSMTFEEVVKQQIEQRKAKARFPRLWKFLNGKKTARKTKVLARLEQHARLHLVDEGITVGDDWSVVKERDWASFFDNLITFLSKLLPLILPLFI